MTMPLNNTHRNVRPTLPATTPPGRQQSGFIMILVAIFLLVLMVGSAQLFTRIAEDTVTSGTLRDSTEALMLAETAMEHLRGQYINTLDSVAEAPSNGLDRDIAGQLTGNMAAPDGVLFPYMYYVSAGAGLDQTQPAILQKIADGEGAGADGAAMAARSIATNTAQLRINNLFASPGGTAVSPMLYVLDAQSGLLTASAAANWNAEVSSEKAAVWIEVIQNPSNGTAVDLFVQAMAQVGTAKSYVQRYIGTYNNVLGSISTLAEASNIDRARP